MPPIESLQSLWDYNCRPETKVQLQVQCSNFCVDHKRFTTSLNIVPWYVMAPYTEYTH